MIKECAFGRGLDVLYSFFAWFYRAVVFLRGRGRKGGPAFPAGPPTVTVTLSLTVTESVTVTVTVSVTVSARFARTVAANLANARMGAANLANARMGVANLANARPDAAIWAVLLAAGGFFLTPEDLSRFLLFLY